MSLSASCGPSARASTRATAELLACSASVQPEVRADALDAGCDDFEGKPFDVATFASRVRDLIRRRTETGLGAGSTI